MIAPDSFSWAGLDWNSLSLAISQFHFLRPGWFGLLPILLFLLWYQRQRRHDNDWQHVMDRELLDAILLRNNEQQRFSPTLLSAIMFAFIVLILAGPSWQKQASPLLDDKAPLVIALALDDTMLAQDLSPNRLHHAKQKIRALLEQRRAAPTALLVYAGSTHRVLPFTEDTELLNFYLTELSPEIMPRAGNKPQPALDMALQLLARHAQVRNSVNPNSDTSPLPASVVFVASQWPLQDHIPKQQQHPITLQDAAEITVLMVQPSNANNATRLQPSAGINTIAMTTDNTDIQQLQARVQSQWTQQQPSNDATVWLDAGYYLLWPLLALMLIWFRRGMVLQW